MKRSYIADALRGERARVLVERDYRYFTNTSDVWSLKDLSVRDMLDTIVKVIKSKGRNNERL
jgi:hypothetical protein